MDQTDLLAEFMKKLESLQQPEEKLREAIAFMRSALSQEQVPYFKGFWEARKLCVPLFKEGIPPSLRDQFWNDYRELTREGRRLKGILDEESDFAVEQITLAVEGLEKELAVLEGSEVEMLSHAPPLEFAKIPQALSANFSLLEKKQGALSLLNTYAARINTLRKELMQTEMRIRFKNQFFKNLSALGDKVFPRRKTLIKEVSDLFLEKVSEFVEAHFSEEHFSHDEARRQVFFFREEIKGMQAIAKLLTLTTHTFTTTRTQLSHCWDKLQGMEKEFKREAAHQRQKSSENTQAVSAKIEEISASFQSGGVPARDGERQLDEVLSWMRQIELTRSDVKALKEAVRTAREPMQRAYEEEEELRTRKEKEQVQKKREEVEAFKLSLAAFKENLAGQNTESLESLRRRCAELSLTKGERQLLEREVKSARDALALKEEDALLLLSEGDRAAFDQLQAIYEQRKLRRQELKGRVEEYRKILGGSNLDFEKAIEYNQLMAQEKENLEQADMALQEVAQKMRALKGKRVEDSGSV